LLLLAGADRTGGRLLRKALLNGREHFPRFETLEECEKAYEALLGGDTQGEVVVEPRYVADEKKAPELEGTPPPTPAPEPAKIKSKPVGQPEHKEAERTYEPPRSGDGKPDSEKGWDYQSHGDDWDAMGSCGGGSQSPIDIVKFVDIGGQTKSVLWFDYYADPSLNNASKMVLTNDGHGLFHSDPALDLGYVKLGAMEYEAYEFEFHAPSEHSLDGQVFPLELQVLHKDPKGKHVLAVSMLFKYGASNEFLAALREAVPELPIWSGETGAATAAVTSGHPDFFNLEHILPMSKIHPGRDLTFYNYAGSLTQPPCTEGIDWWVSAEPMDATKEEIQHVRNAIMAARPTKKGNNRNTQPIGDRKVLVGHTGFQHHVKSGGGAHKLPTPPASRGYSTQDAPWKPEEKAEEAKEE